MKKILFAALLNAAAFQAHAEAYGNRDFDCSDYFGLNICAASFESTANQLTYVEENQNKFTTEIEEVSPLSTSLTYEDANHIDKENPFENSDAFRAYMKTLSSTASTNTDSEFSVTKRILDDENFGLDCRVVTDTIYELSSSNYYDCALQRYF